MEQQCDTTKERSGTGPTALRVSRGPRASVVMLLPVFHAVVAAMNSYTLWYDQRHLDIPFPSEEFEKMYFKGRTMFLTVWCLILSTLYFFVSFLNDLIGTNERYPQKPPFIRQFKDVMFSVTFPVAIFVSTGFWAIYLYDYQLIFPDFVNEIVPFWVNSVMHIFVAVFIFIELLVTNISYPSKAVGISITLVFNLAYLVWMHVLYVRTGTWPYPIFEVISFTGRFVFIACGMVVGLSYYLFGEKISSREARHMRPVNGINAINGFNGINGVNVVYGINGMQKKIY